MSQIIEIIIKGVLENFPVITLILTFIAVGINYYIDLKKKNHNI